MLPGMQRATLPGSVIKALSPMKKADDTVSGLKQGLYGWLTFTASPDAESLYGLNLLGNDGSITNVLSSTNGYLTGIWLRDGKWCSYAPAITTSGEVVENFYVEYDASTGEMTSSEVALTPDKVFIASCYDPEGDTAYGYTYDATGEGVQFSKALGTAPTEIVKVADAAIEDNLRAICFNTKKGVVAGLNGEGSLVEVDPATGVSTVIGALDVPYFYLAGMAYDAATDSYIYNAQPREENSYLYSINANTLEAKLLQTYTNGDSFIGLWVVGEAFHVNKSAPQKATELTTDFKSGANTGSFLFTMPSLTMGESPILGNVDWILTVDGKEVRRGSSASGSVVTVDNLELSTGMHQFTVTCSLGQATGESVTLAAFIGKDTPVMPKNITLSAETIKWDAVTEGVNGGYINPEEVTYTVWLDDEMIAEGIKDTETASKIAAGQPLHIYTAKVMATYDGKDSEVGTSNDLTYGDGLTIPVSLAPTDAEVGLFTTLDANGDGKAFKWSSTMAYFGGKVQAFYCPYHGKNASDDWLWLPAVIFNDASKVYSFRMNAFKANKYAEKYEVKIGTAPTVEAMTQTLIEPTTIEAGAVDPTAYPPVPATANFLVPAAGKYYIGIHCISDADQYGLYVNDFHVEVSDYSSEAPQPVTELTAVAGEKGALNAEVSFKMPTTDILGKDYAADKDLKAYLTVNDAEDEIELTGKPGATVTTKVDTKQGENVIKVFTADGTVHGPEMQTKVFTGLDVPMVVNNFNITTSMSNMDIILTWEAPTEGENGGYVAPTGNTYYLAQVVDGAWQILGAMGKDVFTYTVSLPEGTPQGLYTLGVLAGNASGNSGSLTGQSVEAGVPYTLPMNEDFGDGNVDKTPLANYSGGDYKLRWGIGDAAEIDEYLGNNGKLAFIGYSNSYGAAQKGRISLPRFTTTGINKPAFVMETLGECCTSVDVYASAFGVPMTLVQTVDISSLNHSEQTVTVDLSEKFANCSWVQIDLIPTVNVYSSYSDAFVLYGYKVKNMEAYDFGISAITGSDVAQYGVSGTYTGVIVNEGTEANLFPGGKWTLTDGEGNQLATVNVPAGTEPMESGATMDCPIAFTPTADNGNKFSLTFAINAGDDSNVNDNRTLDVQIVKGDALVITDLTASEIGFESVTMEWSALAGASKVQSFEDETPFVLSPEEIGGFKNIDKDGNPTFTFEGGEELPGAQQPGAYTVWSSNQLASYLGGATFPAADGDKFLIAFSAAPKSQGATVPQTDDWLISPAVAGGTLFSFAAMPISYSFPETLQVYYSTDNDDVDSFKLLKEFVVKGAPGATQLQWEELSVQLPEDAKYVAIRYCSTDMLGIMLDKIAYVPADSKLDIAGFNIYRDGRMLEEKAPCTDNSYTDTTVKENTPYTYMVVPVLSNGVVGLDSNTLTIRTTGVEGVVASGKGVYAAAGVIVVKGYEGEAVVVASANGMTIGMSDSAAAEERYDAAPGVYVVKAGNDVVKLIVK